MFNQAHFLSLRDILLPEEAGDEYLHCNRPPHWGESGACALKRELKKMRQIQFFIYLLFVDNEWFTTQLFLFNLIQMI